MDDVTAEERDNVIGDVKGPTGSSVVVDDCVDGSANGDAAAAGDAFADGGVGGHKLTVSPTAMKVEAVCNGGEQDRKGNVCSIASFSSSLLSFIIVSNVSKQSPLLTSTSRMLKSFLLEDDDLRRSMM